MPRYTIRTSKQVNKFLAHHPLVAKRFIAKLDVMEQNPLDKRLDIQVLGGVDNHYRLRVGKYRFLCEIMQDRVLIYFYKADSRGSIYK